MIINQSVGQDFTTMSKGVEFKISTEKQAFIIDLLSKNIYKDPISTIIREYTSNAFDSNVAANVEKPIVVKIDKDNGGEFFSVTDFGLGLSPDMVSNVFTQYGESTKSDDNNQIGGFGIGSKSAFAYSDIFLCNTIFDGIMYNYMITKTSGNPEMILMNQSETKEHNGTEIKIYIKQYDSINFQRKIMNTLVYFKNVVYEKYGEVIQVFGKQTIYENDLFYINSLDETNEVHAVIGCVKYPINYNLINMSKICVNIGLKFNIGELDLTISREELRYTDETIQKIKNKINELSNFVLEQYISKNNWCKNYDEYYEKLNDVKHVLIGGSKLHISHFAKVNTKYPRPSGIFPDLCFPKNNELKFLKVRALFINGSNKLMTIKGNQRSSVRQIITHNDLKEHIVINCKNIAKFNTIQTQFIRSLYPDKKIYFVDYEKSKYGELKYKIFYDFCGKYKHFMSQNMSKRMIAYINFFEKPVVKSLLKISDFKPTKAFIDANKAQPKVKVKNEGVELQCVECRVGSGYKKLFFDPESITLYNSDNSVHSKGNFKIIVVDVNDVCDDFINVYKNTTFYDKFMSKNVEHDKYIFVYVKSDKNNILKPLKGKIVFYFSDLMKMCRQDKLEHYQMLGMLRNYNITINKLMFMSEIMNIDYSEISSIYNTKCISDYEFRNDSIFLHNYLKFKGSFVSLENICKIKKLSLQLKQYQPLMDCFNMNSDNLYIIKFILKSLNVNSVLKFKQNDKN